MSNRMQSVFTLRLISTLFSILLILIRGINGQSPYEDQDSIVPKRSYQGHGHAPEFEPDPACNEVADSGAGQQVVHVWYFNIELTQCRQLLYRGQGGSPNMFPTRRECERRCLRHYTEGAEMAGPKIKAAVEHLVDRRDYRNKLLSHRSAQSSTMSSIFRDRTGRSGKRKNRINPYNDQNSGPDSQNAQGQIQPRGRYAPNRRSNGQNSQPFE